MGDVVMGVGLVSILLGAWSGFALLLAVDRPGALRRVGVVDPSRVRQVHLDWIVMGVLMVVVAVAIPEMPSVSAGAIVFGGVVNPLSFVPMAFSRTVATTRWFQAVSMISFLALSIGLTAAVWSWFVR